MIVAFQVMCFSASMPQGGSRFIGRHRVKQTMTIQD